MRTVDVYVREFRDSREFGEALEYLWKKKLVTKVHKRMTEVYANTGYCIYLPGIESEQHWARKQLDTVPKVVVYQDQGLEMLDVLQKFINMYQIPKYHSDDEIKAYYLGEMMPELNMHAYFIRTKKIMDSAREDFQECIRNKIMIVSSPEVYDTHKLCNIITRILQDPNTGFGGYWSKMTFDSAMTEMHIEESHALYEMAELPQARAFVNNFVKFYVDNGVVKTILRFVKNVAQFHETSIYSMQ